jgi:hypothetical protein
MPELMIALFVVAFPFLGVLALIVEVFETGVDAPGDVLPADLLYRASGPMIGRAS